MNYIKQFSMGGRAFIGNFPILLGGVKECQVATYSKTITPFREDCNCEAAGYFSIVNTCQNDSNKVLVTCPDGTTFNCYKECTPISGCTNPSASNYNPDATIEDGSCIPYTCEYFGYLTQNIDGTCSSPGESFYSNYSITVKYSNTEGPCPGGHQCDRAVFKLLGNGILLESGEVNLNNGSDGGDRTSGPFVIRQDQAELMSAANPLNQLDLALVCDLDGGCHESVSWVIVTDQRGTEVYNGCPVGNFVTLHPTANSNGYVLADISLPHGGTIPCCVYQPITFPDGLFPPIRPGEYLYWGIRDDNGSVYRHGAFIETTGSLIGMPTSITLTNSAIATNVHVDIISGLNFYDFAQPYLRLATWYIYNGPNRSANMIPIQDISALEWEYHPLTDTFTPIISGCLNPSDDNYTAIATYNTGCAGFLSLTPSTHIYHIGITELGNAYSPNIMIPEIYIKTIGLQNDGDFVTPNMFIPNSYIYNIGTCVNGDILSPFYVRPNSNIHYIGVDSNGSINSPSLFKPSNYIRYIGQDTTGSLTSPRYLLSTDHIHYIGQDTTGAFY